MSRPGRAHHSVADLYRVGRDFPSAALLQTLAEAHVEPHAASHAAPPRGDVVLIEAVSLDDETLALVGALRGRTTARILLVSPSPSVDQRIEALGLGADHVLDAVIDPRELAAILRNAVRPHPIALVQPRAGEEGHRWVLEAERWMLIAPNAREIRLTRSEHAVLDLLIGAAGIVQPRATLRAAIDGDASRERVLDVLLSRLRRKVWDIANMELPLRSARSEGYVFAGGIGRAAPLARSAGAAMR